MADPIHAYAAQGNRIFCAGGKVSNLVLVTLPGHRGLSFAGGSRDIGFPRDLIASDGRVVGRSWDSAPRDVHLRGGLSEKCVREGGRGEA